MYRLIVTISLLALSLANADVAQAQAAPTATATVLQIQPGIGSDVTATVAFLSSFETTLQPDEVSALTAGPAGSSVRIAATYGPVVSIPAGSTISVKLHFIVPQGYYRNVVDRSLIWPRSTPRALPLVTLAPVPTATPSPMFNPVATVSTRRPLSAPTEGSHVVVVNYVQERCADDSAMRTSLTDREVFALAYCLDGRGKAKTALPLYRYLAHRVGTSVRGSPIDDASFVRVWFRIAQANFEGHDLGDAAYAARVADLVSVGTRYQGDVTLLTGQISDALAVRDEQARQAHEAAMERRAQEAAASRAPPSTTQSGGDAPEFESEAQAQAHCPTDTVVWLNTNSGIYHYAGMRWYGNTNYGAYVCEKEAMAAGDRATENGQ